MDNNQNLDAFDGLPLELWMNQQHHLSTVGASLPTTVYHQSHGVRDYVSPRNLPLEESLPHPGPNPLLMSSAALQQYSVSSSSRTHHYEPQTTSQERSAWSHLLSLDPTLAAIGSHQSVAQDPLRQMYNKYLPVDGQQVQKTKEETSHLVKGSTGQIATSFAAASLPQIQFSSAPSNSTAMSYNSFTHLPPTDITHDKTSQHLSQLMNLPKMVAGARKDLTSTSLTVSTDVPSLESGSYSPVSPPASATEELSSQNSGQNSGRVAELLLRDQPEVLPSPFPPFSSSLNSDIFDYSSQTRKAESNKSNFNSQENIMYSKTPQVVMQSGMVPSPSDVPLDMTTPQVSRTNKDDKKAEFPTVGHIAPSTSNNDRSSLLQTLLSKSQGNVFGAQSKTTINSTGASEIKPLPLSLPSVAIENIMKPKKSTPKKSNFYGRDASLFSFESQPPLGDSLQASGQFIPGETSSLPHETNGKAVIENETIQIHNKTLPENFEAPLVEGENLVKSNEYVANATSETLNVGEFLSPETDITQGETKHFVGDPLVDASTFDINSSTSGYNSSLTQSVDSFIDACTIGEKESGKETNLSNTHSLNSDVPATDGKIMSSSLNTCTLDENMQSSSITNNTEIQTAKDQDAQIPDNVIQTTDADPELPSKPRGAKAPKGKKRKTDGLKTRQNKKVTKQQPVALSTVAFDGSTEDVKVDEQLNNQNISDEDNDIDDNQEEESYSNLNVTPLATSSKRKRGAPRSRAPSVDLAPRRSSSRKSKDNAMRLIELQADSSYHGIAQAESELPPVQVESKPNRKRKAQVSGSFKGVNEGLDDLTDSQGSLSEDDSDEKDGDYFIDEEEAMAAVNEDFMDQEGDSKKTKEKKMGGLKISIKLSGDSSAEIVSGIQDSQGKRKRKNVRTKTVKGKGKKKKVTPKKLQPPPKVDDEEPYEELDMSVEDCTSDNVLDNLQAQEKDHEEESPKDGKDRQMSLMEKYFSSAQTAAVAVQNQKNVTPRKVKKIKKKVTDKLGTGTKTGKSDTGKSVSKKAIDHSKGKQKGSVTFDLASDSEKNKSDKNIGKDDAEVSTLKFVCGYCPQKYHNKQDLLAHIAAHMAEMEGKDSFETPSNVESVKKAVVVVSRDPRANRPSGNNGQPAPSKVGSQKQNVTPGSVHSKDQNAKPTSVADKQKFKCGECGQIFSTKPSLLDHVRAHTADKPFECDICHKCFTERNLLSAHRKTHVQEKLLRCHMCSKAFVHKSDLSVHMQSHPKRSNISTSSIKSSMPNKKSVKKSIQDKHEKSDPLPLKKPKSFASALSGNELDVLGKSSGAPSVLLLKRGDTEFSAPKMPNTVTGKGGTIDPKVATKPNAAFPQKTNSAAKISDATRKTVESKSGVDKPKDSLQSNSRGDVSTSILEAKPKEASVTSDVCTCKECPDCVTRFLQSFAE